MTITVEYYRITEWLRLAGTSGDHFTTHPLKQGQRKQAGQDHIQTAFGLSAGTDSTTSLGNLCQCSVALTVKWFFLNAEISLTFKQNVCILFCLGLSLGTTYKQLGPVYFKPCLPIFYTPMSCCSTGIDSPSSQSLLPGEMLQCTVLVALHSSFSSISLLYWGSQDWIQHSW